jgi:acetate---CoA ligase (ADP-forming)
MKLFFEPNTVALIGASTNRNRPGNQLFRNMEACFGDRFYPVNPRVERIGEKRCYKSILDVPAEIDLAVVFIPARGVPQVLEECAAKGIRRVIIESAGFAEAGPEGKALEERCHAIAKKRGLRLWGPNCMGLINVHRTKVLSFMASWVWQGVFTPGVVSLVVQSGMLSAGFLGHIMGRTPFGLSKVCSIGNKLEVDETDLLEYFVEDPETEVIAMYLESIEKGRRFLDLVRSTQKPIVVLKGGRSSFGTRAAVSHTSALAQDDRVLDSALRQSRVIRVRGLTELLDVARCLGASKVRKASGARVAVLTFSGGGGVVTSDTIADLGMELADLAPATLSRLKALFPDWMDPSNPVDLYPAYEKRGTTETLKQTIEAVVDDPAVDAVYLHVFAPPAKGPIYDYDHMARAMGDSQKPIVVWVMGHPEAAREITRELENRGIPTVAELSKGVRILAALTLRR